MKNRQKKYLSVLLSLCIVLIFLFSVLYIAIKAEHNCMGENCPICECIHLAEQIVRQIESGIPGLRFLSFLLIILFTALTLKRPVLPCSTPVSRKIRMNNWNLQEGELCAFCSIATSLSFFDFIISEVSYEKI